MELVFGYPGGAILPAYDEMTRHPEIRHVLARHEQGATHMADGYARASGKLGVVIATSGPGATNLITGLGTAMMDSSPILCITGQVPTTAMGGDAFQETDTVCVSQSVTKHNYLVTDVEDLADVIAEACQVALGGRPGPVLVDIPKDVQLASAEHAPGRRSIRLPGRRPEPAPESGLRRALALISDSERP
ncbi:MAG: thiamine pyrophosphate-binding protein, partial [Acidobacteriota bacterium]